ncbi:hypothetical protein I5M32_13580 [Pedobacter sp. SD-b]|uniref:Uncharacterized protein n=1 Tax=Pedobacter segetis TaxID=2793069 RepID=A0ABS1BP31_9SPHI|nr:hypothetical protein [Pedobacter segetis]MBK0383994.1 hypothetical protein [Pedobacter segetis]
MERSELIALMRTIFHQQHSSILGGMQAEYEELERLGYIKINWEEEDKLTAVITAEGKAFVGSLLPDEK